MGHRRIICVPKSNPSLDRACRHFRTARMPECRTVYCQPGSIRAYHLHKGVKNSSVANLRRSACSQFSKGYFYQ